MLIAHVAAGLSAGHVAGLGLTAHGTWLLVLIAASASFVAIGFIVGDIKELAFWPRAQRLTLSITALLLSWLLIHTLFAFHYARLYYFLPKGRGEHHRGKSLR